MSLIFYNVFPQSNALCTHFFTMCLNPVAWSLSETEGYSLPRPVCTKLTHLLIIDDLKVYRTECFIWNQAGYSWKIYQLCNAGHWVKLEPQEMPCNACQERWERSFARVEPQQTPSQFQNCNAPFKRQGRLWLMIGYQVGRNIHSAIKSMQQCRNCTRTQIPHESHSDVWKESCWSQKQISSQRSWKQVSCYVWQNIHNWGAKL